jgi:hypothetical protein
MNVRPEPWTTPCTGKETQQIKKNNNDDNKANDDKLFLFTSEHFWSLNVDRRDEFTQT